MDKIILIGIGAAAVCYILRLIWRSIKGESTCSCSGACGNTSCKSKK